MKKKISLVMICLIAVSASMLSYKAGSKELQFNLERLIESPMDDWAPCILQDSTDKIWVFFLSNRADDGLWHIFYTTSADGGITWLEVSLFLPASTPGLAVFYSPVAFQDSTGRIWVAWLYHMGHNADQVWFSTSDDGENWTPGRLLCDGHNDMGCFIEAEGKIWFFFSPISTGWSVSYKTTEDGGNTWSGLVPITASGMRHAHATVLSNGTLFVVYKVGVSGGEGDVGYSMSSNGALTWRSGIVDDPPSPQWDDTPRVTEYNEDICVVLGRSYTREGYEWDVWLRFWNNNQWEDPQRVTDGISINDYPSPVSVGTKLWVVFQTQRAGGPQNRDIWLAKTFWHIDANVDIDPDTLNLKSNGQWITAYITLPEGYNVEDIVLETVYLDGTPAEWSEIQNGTYMAKFDRATVQASLTSEPDYESAPKFYELTLTVTGELMDGTMFEGSDTIRVLSK